MGSLDGLDGNSCRLQRLVDNLEEKALLRIYGLGLGGRDAEELGIKPVDWVGQEV
jgi:hypothetical protein